MYTHTHIYSIFKTISNLQKIASAIQKKHVLFLSNLS